ncbi:lipopolysaccharide biosynthesis protein [Celeribacter halophilus]|uniref:lipopolysaccharide biosynthesis protein n=1 Tax=Celeribacter halophilus TaxID=576117 RepID=UPI003A93EEA9
MLLLKALGDDTPRGRMMRGVLANVYDKGAVTLVQFLSIPVLTSVWGASGYGIWLMLLTVPTYIALSDMGFGTAAGVVLTQEASHKDYDRCNVVLQSTIAFVIGTVSLAAIAALGFAVWYWQYGSAKDSPFTTDQIALAICFITGYALVMTQMSIVTVVYRATHKFAFAMCFAGTWILLEGLSLVLMASHGFGLAEVAGAYFGLRLCGYCLFIWLLKRREPWVKIGLRHARLATIRELANPSAAALGLTFATAISLQGVVLALGATAGPTALAIFGAARTLSRAPLQLSSMVLRPSIPELTRAITEDNAPLKHKLNRTNITVTLAVTLPFAGLLIVVGPRLLASLSDGALIASVWLFVFLSLSATTNALWMAIATPLIAMNRQAEFSYLYLGLTIVGVFTILMLQDITASQAALVVSCIEVALLVVLLQHIRKK